MILPLGRIFLDGLEKWLTVNSYRIENSKRQTYSATYIEVVEVMWWITTQNLWKIFFWKIYVPMKEKINLLLSTRIALEYFLLTKPTVYNVKHYIRAFRLG